MNVEINGPKILGYLFGNTNLPITETMRNSWIIMAFILFLCIFLTHRMQKIPKGKQALAEKAVLMIDSLVESTMGEGCQAFSPYIMTLMMSSLFGSLASLFWMRSTTADLNTTLGWAIITFVLITFNKIKYGGIKGYLKGFLEPIFVMAPLNVLSEIATPVSMSFRHFGNMAGGLRTIASNANTAQQGLSGLASGAKGVGGAFSALKPTMAMTGAMFAGSVLAAGVTAAASAVMALQGNLMDTAAEYVGIKARLGLIAGSQQNVAALNDMIYQSAQRARGGYLDMAQAVSQLTLNARDAFPDPREAVSFIEGTQKLFVVGGASKENQKNAMFQLTQAMASGRLQGDEIRSISENAPMIQNILAKSMGVSRGQLKQLASEGKITADVIKTAIIGNMAEINAQFEAMPKKWGDHFTDLKNVATRAFVPIYDDISTLANSQGVKQFISGAKTGIVFLSNLIRKMTTGFGQFMAVAKPGILVLGDIIKSFATGMGELFPEVPQLKPIPDQKVKLVSEQTTSGQNPSPAKPKDNGIQRLIAGAKVGAAVVAKAIGGIVTGIGYLLSGITKAGAYIASWIGGAFTVAAKLAAGFFGIISAGFPVVLGLVAGLATVWAICNAQQAYSIALAKAQAVWDAVVSAGMVARRTALGIVAGAMFAWNVIRRAISPCKAFWRL